jgi:hypothetical protein
MQSQYQEPNTPGAGGTARAEAQATAAQARAGAGEVAETVQQQAGQVARQAGTEARRIVDQTRGRLSDEAQVQTRRTADGLRQWSDELASMADSAKPDSPVREAVHQIASSGRRAADYLDRRGLEGVVGELQEFGRRRPGAFLLGAAMTGFLVGRMAKAAATSSKEGSADTPSRDVGQEPRAFEADPGQRPTTPQPAPPPSYRPASETDPQDIPRPAPAASPMPPTPPAPPSPGAGGVR